MDIHLPKVNYFCRFCKNLLGERKRNRKKESVLNILKEQYPELGLELHQEDPHQFHSEICAPCWNKCTNWKTANDKHKMKEKNKPANSREPFTSSLSIVPLLNITTGLICSQEPGCKVCDFVLPHNPEPDIIGPSPSKILRTEVPQVSPRDKLDPKKKKSKKIPLTPMGVLAHRLRTLDRSLVPPSA